MPNKSRFFLRMEGWISSPFFEIKIVTERGKCGFQREILQNNVHLKNILVAFNYSWFIKKNWSKNISVLKSQQFLQCFIVPLVERFEYRWDWKRKCLELKEFQTCKGPNHAFRWHHLPGMCYYNLTPQSINNHFLWKKKNGTAV